MSGSDHGQRSLSRDPVWAFVLVPAAFGLVALLPFLSGGWLLSHDAYRMTVPTLVWQSRILKEGMWPFWALNAGFGLPWNLMAGSTPYYPIQVLWGLLVGWSIRQYLLFILLHIVLGGYLSARFARRSGLGAVPALFFALAFVGNGFVLAYFSNPCLFVPYFWWPLLALGLFDLHEEGRRWTVGVAKVSLALFFLKAGYPLFVLFVLIATFVSYGLLVRREGNWLQGPKWARLLLSAAIAFLLVLPDVATNLEALPISGRLHDDTFYEHGIFSNVSNPLQFATLLFPAYFHARDWQLGSLWLERSWWVGTLSVVMVLVGLRVRPARIGTHGGLALVALGFLLFSFGGHAFLRESMNWVVPGLSFFQHVSMARAVPMCLLCYLGAEGFQSLIDQDDSTKAANPFRRLAVTWTAYLLACTVAAFLFPVAAPQRFYEDSAEAWAFSALMNGFFLLVAFTAYALRGCVPRGGAPRWPVWILAVQFLIMGNAGYQFKWITGRQYPAEIASFLDSTFSGPFAVSRPKENVRHGSGASELQNFLYGGNDVLLEAYVSPQHRWLADIKKEPFFAEVSNVLVSCRRWKDPGAESSYVPDSGETGCPDVTFSIDYYFGNRIQISGKAAAPAVLVVHDFFDPNWRATLDGRAVPVRPVMKYFKGVQIPAGDWNVVLEFGYPYFPYLWAAPLVGLLALAVCLSYGGGQGGLRRA